MAASAYILIQTDGPETRNVFEQVRAADLVKEVHVVTGRYDVIALIEAETASDILEFMMKELRYLHGITKTETCFTVPQVEE